MPPSTNRMTPLIPLASGDNRNTMALAISEASRNSLRPVTGRDWNQQRRVHLLFRHSFRHRSGCIAGCHSVDAQAVAAQEEDTRRTQRASACLEEL